MVYNCDVKMMAVRQRLSNITKVCLELGMSINDVYFDDKLLGKPLKTSRGAFTLPIEEGVTHRCVLQDDVEVCADFKDFINMLVNAYPNDVFSLYCRSKKMYDVPNGSVVRTGGGLWGPAIIIPVKYIKPVFDELDEYAPEYPHDDRWYAWFCKKHGIRVLTTIPNPVQHIMSGHGMSVLKHGFSESYNYDNGNLLRFNWKLDEKANMGATVTKIEKGQDV